MDLIVELSEGMDIEQISEDFSGFGKCEISNNPPAYL